MFVLVIFVLLMLPVLCLSFVNRASGDDYGYGAYTRAAWVSSHSLAAVIGAAWQTVCQYYGAWQGTWFSIFVFTLQPEVFHDGAYVLVAFLMLFLWIGSTFYLFKQILGKQMGMEKWSRRLLTLLFLMISIEWIPGTKSSIYWFNGCAHYMLPFTMCQMAAAWLFQYAKDYKKSTLTGIIVLMTLLGGSNYQAALLILVTACYSIASAWFLHRDKRIFRLFWPVCMELAGLGVSAAAPGNRVRAGEGFGFSAGRVFETIGCSFLYGIRDVFVYLKERPLVFAGLLVLFLVMVMIFYTDGSGFCFRHPVWLVLMLFCLYSAMQAPAVYAGVEVSQGVANTNFLVFMLTASGVLLILAGRLADRMKRKCRSACGKEGTDQADRTFRLLVLSGILFCLLSVFVCRSSLKISTSYQAFSYLASGQAADYKEQMELQTRLLEGTEEDVVVPGINDVQGPLMHMPVTDRKEAWTNTVTAQFYGRHSVVSMERDQWMKLYGDTEQ